VAPALSPHRTTNKALHKQGSNKEHHLEPTRPIPTPHHVCDTDPAHKPGNEAVLSSLKSLYITAPHCGNQDSQSLLVRIHPTSHQQVWFVRWFEDFRRTYNLTMCRVLSKSTQLHAIDSTVVKKDLYDTMTTDHGVKTYIHQRHRRILRTPKWFRQKAVDTVIGVATAHHRHNKRVEPHNQPKDNQPCEVQFNPAFMGKCMKQSDTVYVEIDALCVINDSAVSLFTRDKSNRKRSCVFQKLRTDAGLHTIPVGAKKQSFRLYSKGNAIYIHAVWSRD